MSLNPLQDPGNPANPNSVAFQQIHGTGDVNKDETGLAKDSPIKWIILGLFGGLIILNILIM